MKKFLTVLMVGSAFMASTITAHAEDAGKDAKKEAKGKKGEKKEEKKEEAK